MAVGFAVVILGIVQAVFGRQFWSSARFGQQASRRGGWIAVGIGVIALGAGYAVQHTFG